MKSAKVRLLESCFKSYTGMLCGIQFEDGISVSELPFVDQQRICSSMRAETIEGTNVSPSGIYSERHGLSANNVKETTAPVNERMERVTTQAHVSTQPTFSREELEAVADSEGIAGLRQIGNELGVKGKGIVEMIEGILKAQGGE
ncbi:TPA: hypothetical protein ACJJYX_004347 [Enterobacter cloacae]